MKKTTDAWDVGGDSRQAPSESTLVLPFRIIKLDRIGPFGTKIAVGSLEIDGLGSLNFECFLRDNALDVAPESIRSRFTGLYARTFKFDAAFRAALAEVARERLEADGHAE